MKRVAKISQSLPQRELRQIVGLLSEHAGVDARSLDTSRLQWIVEARLRHLHLSDAATYVEQLRSSPEEIQALIDAIVVQETRFFRDPAVFESLRRWLPQMASEFPGDLRVLSAPCSTGQEAYSLAAALQLAGIPLGRFTIDAFDISTTGLTSARRGEYPEEAMRSLAPELQNACGTLQHKSWKMHEALRKRIHFERRNLADPNALNGIAQPYHLILCRNLFIYLHRDARAALAQSLAAVLAPGGRLILGSADRVEEISNLFSPLQPAASFAFTHRQHAISVDGNRPATRSKPAYAVVRKHKPAAAHTTQTEPEPSLSTAAGLFHRAVEHHRHGELRKAERRCRQALYLDPKHLPALKLLELLWSQNPNLRLRRALEARILRHRTDAPSATGTWKETA